MVVQRGTLSERSQIQKRPQPDFPACDGPKEGSCCAQSAFSFPNGRVSQAARTCSAIFFRAVY